MGLQWAAKGRALLYCTALYYTVERIVQAHLMAIVRIRDTIVIAPRVLRGFIDAEHPHLGTFSL